MSRLSSRLFEHIHGAPFYEATHRDAVELMPPGERRSWYDIGCGPGLVARLATERGYCATGFDSDEFMIARARRTAAGASFQTSDLATIAASRRTADVVSAASLLAVVPDRHTALSQLASCVAIGGTLLVIEPSALMTRAAAQRLIASGRVGARSWVLSLWSASRRPGRFVDASLFDVEGFTTSRMPLLNGLVDAWVLRRDRVDGAQAAESV